MLGWFQPKCPVTATEKAWIERRLTWLADTFGVDRITRAKVILPTDEFFPEPYSGSEADVQGMLNRVCGYMGVPPGRVDLHFFEDKQPRREYAAGLYVAKEREEIWLNKKNLGDPVAVVGTIAHELAHVLLLGDKRLSSEEEDHELVTDLTTVFLGMGVFGANSVIRESYQQAVTYYSWQISRLGYISERMYGYAQAVFALARDETDPAWAGYFRPNVRGPMMQGIRYLTKTGDNLYRPGQARRDAARATAERRRELLAALASPFAGVRVSATWDLKKIEPEDRQIEALAQLLYDDDPCVSAEAAKCLGRYGTAADESVLALVDRGLHDRVREVRVQAIAALAAIGKQPEIVVPALALLLGDAEFSVRVMAARSLRSFGEAGAEAVPALIECLVEREELAEEVLLTLGAMGTAAAPAEPALREMLQNPDRLLHREVRYALKKIRQGSAEGMRD